MLNKLHITNTIPKIYKYGEFNVSVLAVNIITAPMIKGRYAFMNFIYTGSIDVNVGNIFKFVQE